MCWAKYISFCQMLQVPMPGLGRHLGLNIFYLDELLSLAPTIFFVQSNLTHGFSCIFCLFTVTLPIWDKLRNINNVRFHLPSLFNLNFFGCNQTYFSSYFHNFNKYESGDVMKLIADIAHHSREHFQSQYSAPSASHGTWKIITLKLIHVAIQF